MVIIRKTSATGKLSSSLVKVCQLRQPGAGPRRTPRPAGATAPGVHAPHARRHSAGRPGGSRARPVSGRHGRWTNTATVRAGTVSVPLAVSTAACRSTGSSDAACTGCSAARAPFSAGTAVADACPVALKTT